MTQTSARCTWHLPLTHVLEGWSDIRAFDGTASIIQPLIRSLYDTRTAHQMLALLNDASEPSSYDMVRRQWQGTTHPAISTTGGGSHCRMASAAKGARSAAGDALLINQAELPCHAQQ